MTMAPSSSFKRPLLLAACCLFSLSSAAITYLDQPQKLWQNQVDSVVLDGNGVFLSPNDAVAVVTQANGSLKAVYPKTGRERWSYTPPGNQGLPMSCQSGVTFSFDGPDNFMVYSVIDDPNGITPYTRVISLTMDGQVNWMSIPLEGAAAGDPKVSYDGRYIFLTHNSNSKSVGHFSVLDTIGATPDSPIYPLYSEFNTTNPFSPPGIYHKPDEGYYDGGQGNTHDIVVWGHAPNPADITVGDGAAFVFQFPIGYVPAGQSTAARTSAPGTTTATTNYVDGQPLFWILLGGGSKDWQSTSAPVLTNLGRSLYWSVSRSQFRAWVGEAGSNRGRFNRYRTNNPEFDRGTPRFAAPPNSVALSSSPTQPMIFTGTASTQFVKMDYLMSDESVLIRNTTSFVRARAMVSPDDAYVFFSEFKGVIHMASTEDLEDAWTISESSQLDGEFALSSDGTMLIVADVTGVVRGYQVAEFPATMAPTKTPTAPTAAPVAPPSNVAPIAASIPAVSTPRPTRSPSQPQPTIPSDSEQALASAACSVSLLATLLGMATVALTLAL